MRRRGAVDLGLVVAAAGVDAAQLTVLSELDDISVFIMERKAKRTTLNDFLYSRLALAKV